MQCDVSVEVTNEPYCIVHVYETDLRNILRTIYHRFVKWHQN